MREELIAEFGPLEPLGGGITNHNFRASYHGEEVVVRVAGRDTHLLGIDREVERLANETASALGIAPRVRGFVHGCLVTRFVAGEPIDSARGHIDAIAPALRAFHDSGVVLRTSFDVPRIAREYALRAKEPAQAAIALADRIAAALSSGEHVPVPCHNDLLPANVICGEDGALWIVDWEYAGMGDRYFDLGNLSVNNGFVLADDEHLLEAYWEQPCTPRRLAAVRLMRVMSDVREAMWGVVQRAVSDVDFDFDGYAREHFDRVDRAAADPSFDRWMADAASA
jgi:thiamine kinase-like enzyme